MKTVSGEILSSHPISLSKAAKILSKFSQVDNGATPSFAAYLRRASTSFNELVQVHKELKGSEGVSRKRHGHSSHGVTSAAGRINSVKNCSENDYGFGRSESMNRARDYVDHDALDLCRSRNSYEGEDMRSDKSGAQMVGKVQENGSSHDIQAEIQSRKKKKREEEKKYREVGEEGIHRIGGIVGNRADDSARTGRYEGKKYKKQEESSLEAGNSGSNIGVNAGGRKENRKRKSEVAADSVLDGSEERHKSNKKKRKSDA